MPKYQYVCPSCGTKLSFNKRVTMRRRSCPHCGREITPGEIDRQAMWRNLIGCGVVSALLSCCCCGPVFRNGCDSDSKPNNVPRSEPPPIIAESKPKAVDPEPSPSVRGPIAREPEPQVKVNPTPEPVPPPAPSPAPEPKPQNDAPKLPSLADRKVIWEAFRTAEWEAEKETVEKFGHHPRVSKDTPKYIVEFRTHQAKLTQEKTQEIADRHKLNKADVAGIEADASKHGWRRPSFPPIKDRD